MKISEKLFLFLCKIKSYLKINTLRKTLRSLLQRAKFFENLGNFQVKFSHLRWGHNKYLLLLHQRNIYVDFKNIDGFLLPIWENGKTVLYLEVLHHSILMVKEHKTFYFVIFPRLPVSIFMSPITFWVIETSKNWEPQIKKQYGGMQNKCLEVGVKLQCNPEKRPCKRRSKLGYHKKVISYNIGYITT